MNGIRNVFDSQRAIKPNMSDDTVMRIAAENEDAYNRRLALKAQAQELREALKKINNLPGEIDVPYVSRNCTLTSMS